MSEDIDALRREVDRIDAELLALLNERARLAKKIGGGKTKRRRPFFTPEREHAIYKHLLKSNEGPLLDSQVQAIFREIISVGRSLEKPLTLAFWGPSGSFSHMAAVERFGRSAELIEVESIPEVFEAVEHLKADYGVVPVENSIAGVVPETLDMFPQTNVKICAETYVSISHHLCTHLKSIDEVKRIYAGAQPATQCRRWLKMNAPHAQVIPAVPTSKAAEMAAADPESAAIANYLGAHLAGLPTLFERIQDNPNNRTRFLVVGYNEPAPTGRDKTSIMFNLRNRPGELYRALGAFERHGVNLSMIESRPAQRGTFEYLFYVDTIGHRKDTNISRALETLESYALEQTVLGSYPEAEIPVR
jgi:chorismate mutase/prephenate dehydratase